MSDQPILNDREMLSLIAGLSQAVRCCQQEAETVFCENLTFSQFFIINAVAEKGRLELARLHNILSVEKSTTTRLVDPLIRRGLLVRQKSDHDSRAAVLRLTSEGKKVHEAVARCISQLFTSIQQRIPLEKRAEVYEAVKMFMNAIQNCCSAGP